MLNIHIEFSGYALNYNMVHSDCFAGSFEIALLRLCTAYDVPTNSVIFGSSFIPLEAFTNLSEYRLTDTFFAVHFSFFSSDCLAVFSRNLQGKVFFKDLSVNVFCIRKYSNTNSWKFLL